MASGVRVDHGDVWGGLGLWLALNEPDMARLYAIGEAVDRGLVPARISYPGQAATLAILDRQGIAALVPLTGGSPFGSRPAAGGRAPAILPADSRSTYAIGTATIGPRPLTCASAPTRPAPRSTRAR